MEAMKSCLSMVDNELDETCWVRGSPCKVQWLPSLTKEIWGTEKSAVMVPRAANHETPKTMSAPSTDLLMVAEGGLLVCGVDVGLGENGLGKYENLGLGELLRDFRMRNGRSGVQPIGEWWLVVITGGIPAGWHGGSELRMKAPIDGTSLRRQERKGKSRDNLGQFSVYSTQCK
ncbi:hypothetical protein Tco_0140294 [Tanacetum coccineum]